MWSCTFCVVLINLRHMRMCLVLTLCLAACADFPALDGTISDAARDAPYPKLQALPDANIGLPVADVTLNDRIAALRARAARLRKLDINALQ